VKNNDDSFFNAIGKTFEQCKEKYGLPFLEFPDAREYKKKDFLIWIIFSEYKAVEVNFQKFRPDIFIDTYFNAEKLSDDEIKTILKTNFGKINWILFSDDREKKIWITDDKNLYARYNKVRKILSFALIAIQ